MTFNSNVTNAFILYDQTFSLMHVLQSAPFTWIYCTMQTSVQIEPLLSINS